MTNSPPPDEQASVRRLHLQPKKYLEEWLDFPAHVHQVSYRMKDPPRDRARSRLEFGQVLRALQMSDDNCAVAEKFGYGAKIAENGDRLIIVWEAHTEYYNYQIWHIPDLKTRPLDFGTIKFPDFTFPLEPLGTPFGALDIIISHERTVAPEIIRAMLPGPHIYGSRVFGKEISVVTSFTPDEQLRKRYLIFSEKPDALLQHLGQVTDAVITIENYYHLLLFPFAEFSKAVDRIHELEQHLLRQRETITAELSASDTKTLQGWVTRLTQNFLEVSRFAESMRFQLSASVPYNAIIHSTIRALQEKQHPPFLPLSDYVFGGISGVADGYQQLIKRIEAVEADFQSIISVIRTQVNLIQQEQTLILEDQNLKLLSNVDQTTKRQAILQHTVEGLSVIVIAYYLSSLAGYVFLAFQDLGWIQNATIATGIFVPFSLVISISLIYIGRKVIAKLIGVKKDS